MRDVDWNQFKLYSAIDLHFALFQSSLAVQNPDARSGISQQFPHRKHAQEGAWECSSLLVNILSETKKAKVELFAASHLSQRTTKKQKIDADKFA